MYAPLPRHVAVSPEVLWQALDTQCVLLNLGTEHYFSLNDIGTRMWLLLDRHGDVAAVVEQLLTEYEVDEPTLRRDLADLICRLHEAELVTVR